MLEIIRVVRGGVGLCKSIECCYWLLYIADILNYVEVIWRTLLVVASLSAHPPFFSPLMLTLFLASSQPFWVWRGSAEPGLVDLIHSHNIIILSMSPDCSCSCQLLLQWRMYSSTDSWNLDSVSVWRRREKDTYGGQGKALSFLTSLGTSPGDGLLVSTCCHRHMLTPTFHFSIEDLWRLSMRAPTPCMWIPGIQAVSVCFHLK